MFIDIKDCDLNNDYFHFSNISNVQSIIDNGLKPMVGVASQMVEDRPNVSISQGAKGIMGIINSFIYMFSILKISNIPNEYKKYFVEVLDFSSEELVGKGLACKAMIRKLKEEVYFKINLDEEKLKESKIGGITGFDINLSTSIDKSNLQLVTSENNILSAYDITSYIYEKTKDISIFREMNEDFFYMFDMEKSVLSFDLVDKGIHL